MALEDKLLSQNKGNGTSKNLYLAAAGASMALSSLIYFPLLLNNHFNFDRDKLGLALNFQIFYSLGGAILFRAHYKKAKEHLYKIFGKK